jgi:hypothetical protein
MHAAWPRMKPLSRPVGYDAACLPGLRIADARELVQVHVPHLGPTATPAGPPAFARAPGSLRDQSVSASAEAVGGQARLRCRSPPNRFSAFAPTSRLSMSHRGLPARAPAFTRAKPDLGQQS